MKRSIKTLYECVCALWGVLSLPQCKHYSPQHAQFDPFRHKCNPFHEDIKINFGRAVCMSLGRLFICSLKVDYLMEDFLRVRWDRTLMCLLEYSILKQMDSSITSRAGLYVTLRLCLKSLFSLQLRQQQNSSPKAISTIQSRLVFPKAPYLTSGRGWTWRETWWCVYSRHWKQKSWGHFQMATICQLTPGDTCTCMRTAGIILSFLSHILLCRHFQPVWSSRSRL